MPPDPGRLRRFFHRNIAHRRTERVAIDALEGRITTALLTPYPPGIPLLVPGERFNRRIVDYLKFTRAFNAASIDGYYPLDQFNLDHLQDPQNSPSVFNFFLPGHSPPGPVTQMGLVAPEFQILNASSAITGANYFYNAIGGNNLHRWGSGTAAYAVRLNLDPELSRIIPAANINEDVPSVTNLMDLDPLIRRFDLMLMGGTMTPRMFQSIRESVDRIKPPETSWQWHRERLRQLITAIVTSAEFNVMR